METLESFHGWRRKKTYPLVTFSSCANAWAVSNSEISSLSSEIVSTGGVDELSSVCFTSRCRSSEKLHPFKSGCLLVIITCENRLNCKLCNIQMIHFPTLPHFLTQKPLKLNDITLLCQCHAFDVGKSYTTLQSMMNAKLSPHRLTLPRDRAHQDNTNDMWVSCWFPFTLD